MELWNSILFDVLGDEEAPDESLLIDNLNKSLNSKCYSYLNQIKQILEDDTLTDKECFLKIEKIILRFSRSLELSTEADTIFDSKIQKGTENG